MKLNETDTGLYLGPSGKIDRTTSRLWSWFDACRYFFYILLLLVSLFLNCSWPDGDLFATTAVHDDGPLLCAEAIEFSIDRLQTEFEHWLN